MATGHLDIDLDAIVANWRALGSMAQAEAGAVVKADAYGLGVAPVARALAQAGARKFFVAMAEEGVALRAALGAGPDIHVFSGHMAGDAGLIAAHDLIPMLNSPEQFARHRAALPDHAYGIQLDTGMNRLGLEAPDWAAIRAEALSGGCVLVMSHLACADDPAHAANQAQRAAFVEMTQDCAVPRSLSATGGTLLGADYHFDLIRPGIGLYGGLPFTQARAVVRLSLPVVQTRAIAAGEFVGYSATFTTQTPRRIATVSGGYADGLLRALSGKAVLYAGNTPCPVAGRVSMDLITVDVTHLDAVPDHLDILCPTQGVDALADLAGTIGYEILTSLGARYARAYHGGRG